MARTIDQNARRRDTRREQILAHAREAFADHGLAGAKISDISQSAGISQGLIYHYFDAKETLFAAVITDALEKLSKACRELEAKDLAPHEKIRLAVEEMTQTIARSRDFNRTCLLIAHATQSEDVPETIKEMIRSRRDEPYDCISRILKAGQRAGTLHRGDPDAQAQIFWSVINGFAIYRATRGETLPPPDEALISGIFIKEEFNMSIKIKPFLDEEGRIRQLPSKLLVRREVLRYLAFKFDPEKRYTESEVNGLINQWHTFADHTLVRRELVDARFICRTPNGAQYWRAPDLAEEEDAQP